MDRPGIEGTSLDLCRQAAAKTRQARMMKAAAAFAVVFVVAVAFAAAAAEPTAADDGQFDASEITSYVVIKDSSSLNQFEAWATAAAEDRTLEVSGCKDGAEGTYAIGDLYAGTTVYVKVTAMVTVTAQVTVGAPMAGAKVIVFADSTASGFTAASGVTDPLTVGGVQATAVEFHGLAVSDASGKGSAVTVPAGTEFMLDSCLVTGSKDNSSAVKSAVYCADDPNAGTKVTITGSELTGTKGNGNSLYGGALYCGTGTTVSVSDSTFSGNTVKTFGGAVYAAQGSTLAISGGYFLNNHVAYGTKLYGYGGALYSAGNNAVTVTGTVFAGNTARSGGAIGCTYAQVTEGTVFSNTLTVEKAVFGSTTVDSTAYGGNQGSYGGAIFVGGESSGHAVLKADRSTFNGNSSTDRGNSYGGGAIFLDDYAVAAVTGSLFENNYAKASGGAIRCDAHSELIIGPAEDGTVSRFSVNSAGGNGGAIRVSGGATLSENPSLSVTGAVFSSNVSESDGGAVYVQSAVIAIESSTFSTNAADSWGGAVCGGAGTVISAAESTFTGNTAGSRGGALYGDTKIAVELTSCTFTENKTTGTSSVTNGGAVAFGSNASESALTVTDSTFGQNSSVRGGALFVSAGTVFAMTGGSLSGNTASGNGGAVSFFGTTGAGADFNTVSKVLTGVTVSGNSSTAGDGGAVWVGNNLGGVVLKDCKFTSNTAAAGSGGAVSSDKQTVNPTSFKIEGGTYSSNSAANGGAVYVRHTALAVTGASFESNRAAGDGGAVAANCGSTVTLTNVVFKSNEAAGSGGAVYATNIVYGTTAYSGDPTVIAGEQVTLTANTAAAGAAVWLGTKTAATTADGTYWVLTGAGSDGGDISVGSEADYTVLKMDLLFVSTVSQAFTVSCGEDRWSFSNPEAAGNNGDWAAVITVGAQVQVARNLTSFTLKAVDGTDETAITGETGKVAVGAAAIGLYYGITVAVTVTDGSGSTESKAFFGQSTYLVDLESYLGAGRTITGVTVNGIVQEPQADGTYGGVTVDRDSVIIITVTVTPAEPDPVEPPQTYTVTLVAGEGYTLTAGGATAVTAGSSFVFRFDLGPHYTQSVYAVLANGTALSGNAGSYVIADINADQTVTVTGVSLNVYGVVGYIDRGTVTHENQQITYGGVSHDMIFTVTAGYHVVAYSINGNFTEVPDEITALTFNGVNSVSENVVVRVVTAADVDEPVAAAATGGSAAVISFVSLPVAQTVVRRVNGEGEELRPAAEMKHRGPAAAPAAGEEPAAEEKQ